MVESSKLNFPKKNPQQAKREVSAYRPHLSFALGTAKGRGRGREPFTFTGGFVWEHSYKALAYATCA